MDGEQHRQSEHRRHRFSEIFDESNGERYLNIKEIWKIPNMEILHFDFSVPQQIVYRCAKNGMSGIDRSIEMTGGSWQQIPIKDRLQWDPKSVLIKLPPHSDEMK